MIMSANDTAEVEQPTILKTVQSTGPVTFQKVQARIQVLQAEVIVEIIQFLAGATSGSSDTDSRKGAKDL